MKVLQTHDKIIWVDAKILSFIILLKNQLSNLAGLTGMNAIMYPSRYSTTDAARRHSQWHRHLCSFVYQQILWHNVHHLKQRLFVPLKYSKF